MQKSAPRIWGFKGWLAVFGEKEALERAWQRGVGYVPRLYLLITRGVEAELFAQCLLSLGYVCVILATIKYNINTGTNLAQMWNLK